MTLFKRTVLIPCVLFLTLLMDGILMRDINSLLGGTPFILIPRLLLMTIILIAFYLPEYRHFPFIVSFIGLIYDSYYNGILGVYLFILPMVVLVVYSVEKKWEKNLINIGLTSLIIFILLEHIIVLLFQLLSVTEVDYVNFVLFRLLPSILLNVALFVIQNYLIKRLLKLINY